MNEVLCGTLNFGEKKSIVMVTKARILHKIMIHIITPRTGLINEVTSIERFCTYPMMMKTPTNKVSYVEMQGKVY